MTTKTHRSQFAELSDFLLETHPLWSENPYLQQHLTWSRVYPQAWAWAEGLDPTQIDMYERLPHQAPGYPLICKTILGRISELTTLPLLEEPLIDLSAELRWKMPQRKETQIRAFLAAIKRYGVQQSLIDWCSGKGHLGRIAAYFSGQQLLQVEKNSELCRQSQELNQRVGLKAKVQCMDVLHDELKWPDSPAILAMHACGDLGIAALNLHSQIGGTLALAPCCHHKIRSEWYAPMSVEGRESGIQLHRDHLHFSVAYEIHASSKTRRLRRQGLRYRCALSAVQGAWHISSKPCPRAWLSLPFPEFAARMASRDHFSLPANLMDYDEIGKLRSYRIRARAMLRAPFRRAIEVWLALDKALFLQAQGKTVDLIEFCPDTTSPRNLLLMAR